MINKTGTELNIEYQQIVKDKNRIENEIRDKLKYLCKTYPNVVISQNNNTLAGELSGIIISMMSVKSQLTYINFIEKQLINSGIQLTLSF